MDTSTPFRLSTALAGLALSFAAAGCFSVDFADGVIACGEAGCPPGYACARDGTCQPESQPGCGTTLALGETFEGEERSRLWRDYGEPAQSGGFLIIPAQPDTWAGYESRYQYDLRNASVSAEVAEVASGPEYDVHLSVVSRRSGSPEYEARVVFRDGELSAEWRRDRVSTTVASPIRYGPSAHRFWQIREQGGTMFWETSPDGEQWEVIASDSTPFDVEFVHILAGAGTDDELAAPDGQSRFAGINGGSPHVGYCAASSLRDRFDDQEFTRRWSHLSEWGGCSSTLADGRLQFENDEDGGCQLRSQMLFDLSDDLLTIEAPEVMGLDNDMSCYVELRDVDQARLSMGVYAGRLRFYVNDGESGRTIDSMAYDAEAHRWWGMTVQGSTMRWLVSGDGATWTEVAASPRTVDPERLQLRIGVDGYQQEGIVDQAAFAHLNTRPE